MKNIIAVLVAVVMLGTAFSTPANAGREGRRNTRILVGAILGGVLGAVINEGSHHRRSGHRNNNCIMVRDQYGNVYCEERRERRRVVYTSPQSRRSNGSSAEYRKAYAKQVKKHEKAVAKWEKCEGERRAQEDSGAPWYDIVDCSDLYPY